MVTVRKRRNGQGYFNQLPCRSSSVNRLCGMHGTIGCAWNMEHGTRMKHRSLGSNSGVIFVAVITIEAVASSWI